MDKTSVFSKTGKGVLQLKHKAPPLPQPRVRVLGLIDGKTTLAGLMARSELHEVELYGAVKALSDDGFIREVAISVVVAAPLTVASRGIPMSEGDLDFTEALSKESGTDLSR